MLRTLVNRPLFPLTWSLNIHHIGFRPTDSAFHVLDPSKDQLLIDMAVFLEGNFRTYGVTETWKQKITLSADEQVWKIFS